jgi:hypothetical protein
VFRIRQLFPFLLPYQRVAAAPSVRISAPLLGAREKAHRARVWQRAAVHTTVFPRFALRSVGARLILWLRTGRPRRLGGGPSPSDRPVNSTPARYAFGVS